MAVSKKALPPYWQTKWKNNRYHLLQACICCLFGCAGTHANSIPGTYTAEWTNEFYTTRDTLRITILNSTNNNFFQVARRTMTTGPGQPRYQLLHWIGLYSPKDRALRVSSNGRLLVFDPATGNLIMGTTSYKKL